TSPAASLPSKAPVRRRRSARGRSSGEKPRRMLVEIPSSPKKGEAEPARTDGETGPAGATPSSVEDADLSSGDFPSCGWPSFRTEFVPFGLGLRNQNGRNSVLQVMEQAVDTFLKTLLKSGLLNREQLQTVLRAVPETCRDNAQELADQLIKLGKLSRFQAHKLLQGAALGLM